MRAGARRGLGGSRIRFMRDSPPAQLWVARGESRALRGRPFDEGPGPGTSAGDRVRFGWFLSRRSIDRF
jgi:hypothetical protein